MRSLPPLLVLIASSCTCSSPIDKTFACKTNDDCAQGFACSGGICTSTMGVGGGAGGGSGGAGGSAGDGGARCSSTSQCPSAQWCSNNVCVPRSQQADPCTADEECATSHCADQVCCDTACTDACADCAFPGMVGTCSPALRGTAATPGCDPFLCDGMNTTCPTSCNASDVCIVPLYCNPSSACVASPLPRNVIPPSIGAGDGGFIPNSPMTASDGTWAASSGGAITTTHRWLRCAADGGSCTPLTATGTLSGSNLQTDSSRALATDGDGRPAESSTGTWSPTTNLATNGGLETDTAGWRGFACCTDAGADPAIARNTTSAKFGGASLDVPTPGADNIEGASLSVSAAQQTRYTVSAWVRATAGTSLCLDVSELDNTSSFLRRFSGSTAAISGTGGFTRVIQTGTTGAGTAELVVAVETCGGTPTTTTFQTDGVQVEAETNATPYLETSGSTATKGASTLTGPSSQLPLTQGWAAFRLRPQWTPANSIDAYPSVLVCATTPTNRWHLYYSRADSAYGFERNATMQNIVQAPLTAAAGTADTVIASWSRSELALSVNGAAPLKKASSEVPTGLPATFSLGHFNGEMLWGAIGEGELQDAGIAQLVALGDTDPQFAALPGSPTWLWQAATLSYFTPVTAATYTPQAGDLGATFRLEVTATNSNGSTTALSAPVLVVPPGPTSTGAPFISVFSGGFFESGVLNTSTGTWNGSPTSFAYQWQRCNATGTGCVDATGMGATTNRYTVDATDVGFTLVSRVTATNAGGSNARASSATQVLVGAPPAVRGTGSTAAFNAATTVNLPKPTTLPGDVMIAFLTFSANPGSQTPPAGWTLAVGLLSGLNGAPGVAAYWKIAGASEPVNYKFDWLTSSSGGGAVVSVSGANATTPIAASAVGSPVLQTKTATIPSITTTGPYQRVLGFSGMNVTGSFSTPLTGWGVDSISFGSNPNGGIADRLATSAGATGTTAWVNTVNGSPNLVNSLSLSLAVKQ